MIAHSKHRITFTRRRPRVRPAIVACTLLFGIGVVLAAPGDLDPSFSGNGLLSLRDNDLESQAFAITQQSDGKLVLAGWGQLDGGRGIGFMVARVAEDGTPDSTFGVDGFATADFSSGEDIAGSVLQQPDGKLVLAGTTSTNGFYDIALARFNSDGSLDASFGTNGLVTLDIDGSHESASGLIQQADGKLVIAGAAISGGRYHILFARFNVNGTVDTTFGSGGTTLIDFGVGTESWANGLAQQVDGKLVAAGRVHLARRGDNWNRKSDGERHTGLFI